MDRERERNLVDLQRALLEEPRSGDINSDLATARAELKQSTEVARKVLADADREERRACKLIDQHKKQSTEVACKVLADADREERRARELHKRRVHMSHVMPGGQIVVGGGEGAVCVHCSTNVSLTFDNNEVTLFAKQFHVQLVCTLKADTAKVLGTLYLAPHTSVVLSLDSIMQRLSSTTADDQAALLLRVSGDGLRADREVFVAEPRSFRPIDLPKDPAARSTMKALSLPKPKFPPMSPPPPFALNAYAPPPGFSAPQHSPVSWFVCRAPTLAPGFYSL